MAAPCVPEGGSFDQCDDPGVVTDGDVVDKYVVCGLQMIKIQEPSTCTCGTAPTNYLIVVVQNGASGAAVEFADVKIAGTSIMSTTDSDGISILTIPTYVATPIVQVTYADGNYLPTSKPVDPTTNLIIIYLFEVAAPIEIDPTIENLLSLSDDPSDSSAGAVTLQIPAASFFTASGSVPVGSVYLSVNFVQPGEDIGDKAPGVFVSTDENGNAVPLETMGVFALSAKDAMGEALSASGIGVSVGFGFRLFVLREDGTWHLEPIPEARRRRRQTTSDTIVGEIIINTDTINWYNIDKFPENTRCWFKTYIRDTVSGNEIQSDAFTRKIHNFIAIAEQGGSTSILQLSDSWLNPAPVCFEARCDNGADNAEFSSIPTGIITAYVKGIIRSKATPMQISDYQLEVQNRLNALSYTPEFTDRIRVQLESSAAGPFFTDKSVCEAASFTDGGNVFGFTVAMPTGNTDPFGTSTDRCVARVKITLYQDGMGDTGGGGDMGGMDGMGGQMTSISGGTFNAISVWGAGQYYIDQQEYVFVDIDAGSKMTFLCFNYRCSETDDLTTVTISFEESGDAVLDRIFTYYCDISFGADVISSTGGGYFFNQAGNVEEALAQCDSENNDSLVVLEKTCSGGRILA